jgi:hypothetical protein
MTIAPGASQVDATRTVTQVGTGVFTAGSVRLIGDGHIDPHYPDEIGLPAVVTAIYWKADGNRLQANWIYPSRAY